MGVIAAVEAVAAARRKNISRVLGLQLLLALALELVLKLLERLLILLLLLVLLLFLPRLPFSQSQPSTRIHLTATPTRRLTHAPSMPALILVLVLMLVLACFMTSTTAAKVL